MIELIVKLYVINSLLLSDFPYLNNSKSYSTVQGFGHAKFGVSGPP
jgi:hypothetical protein